MHIRVTRARFDPGRTDEILRLVREQTVPAARQLPGFKSFQVGVDPQAGRLVAISAFESADQTRAMSSLRSPAEAVGIQFEAPELYEVTIEA